MDYWLPLWRDGGFSVAACSRPPYTGGDSFVLLPEMQNMCPGRWKGECVRLLYSFSTTFSLSCAPVRFSLDGSASQAQQLPNSQVLWPDEAVCLRKKKRHSRPDPFARLSDLCHRQLPEDQTAILNSVDQDDPGHATLL